MPAHLQDIYFAQLHSLFSAYGTPIFYIVCYVPRTTKIFTVFAQKLLKKIKMNLTQGGGGTWIDRKYKTRKDSIQMILDTQGAFDKVSYGPFWPFYII